MLTGWGKLNNLAQVTENFIGWGIPFPKILTPFVSCVECFGGAMGVNACKGQSACKSAGNSCKGLNACKTQGFAMATEAQCKAKGGAMAKS